jgi:hypothetical protein
VLPWLALCVAFSPVVADLAGNLVHAREDRCTLLALLLLGLALRGARRRGSPRPLLGGFAVAAGIALELTGIVTGSWSIARLGLPVAVLGLGGLLGSPPLRVLALAFWMVPLPDSLLLLASPGLEVAAAGLTAALLAPLGVPISAVGFALEGAGGRVEVEPAHAGFVLAHVLSALGWFSAVRGGGSVARAAGRALAGGAAALPAQLAVLLSTGLLLAIGFGEAAEMWLHQASWLLFAAGGLALLLWSWRERSRPLAGPARILASPRTAGHAPGVRGEPPP